MLDKRGSSSYMLANDASCETRVQGTKDVADRIEKGRGLIRLHGRSNEIDSMPETQSEMFSKVITGSGEPKKAGGKAANLQ